MGFETGLKCIKCGSPGDERYVFDGCPQCASEGFTVNYTTTYDYPGMSKLRDTIWPTAGGGMWRFKAFLPIQDHMQPITLSEGNTPLIHLKRLGERLNIANLYLKDESRNPTWSYKDRLCSVAVTRAVQEGANVITISSTGNHGAATAAYAARAGLPCVIFTVPQVPQTMKTLMQSYGAYVIATPTPADRWKVMQQCVKEYNWYPTSGYVSPPIGSNPYGIDGYKTISFEIFEELGRVPAKVVVPAAYSDGLYGIWKGMKELKELGLTNELPKMIASEAFGSLTKTIEKASVKPVTVPASVDSVSFSIAGSIGTYQGLAALQESDGYGEVSNDEETMEMQQHLASLEGIYAEGASLTSLVAIAKMQQKGLIKEDETVVAILTSSGLKDPGATAKRLPEVPLMQPSLKELDRLLGKMGFKS